MAVRSGRLAIHMSPRNWIMRSRVQDHTFSARLSQLLMDVMYILSCENRSLLTSPNGVNAFEKMYLNIQIKSSWRKRIVVDSRMSLLKPIGLVVRQQKSDHQFFSLFFSGLKNSSFLQARARLKTQDAGGSTLKHREQCPIPDGSICNFAGTCMLSQALITRRRNGSSRGQHRHSKWQRSCGRRERSGNRSIKKHERQLRQGEKKMKILLHTRMQAGCCPRNNRPRTSFKSSLQYRFPIGPALKQNLGMLKTLPGLLNRWLAKAGPCWWHCYVDSHI
jgi:hypothetical protein